MNVNFLLLACLSLECLMPSSATPVVTVSFQGISHAKLIGPSDAGFQEAESAILQRSGSSPVIDDLRKAAILLSNSYTKPIMGYVLTWIITPQTGEPHNFSKIFWHRTDLRVLNAKAIADPLQRQLIYYSHPVSAGGARLITPFFNLSEYSDMGRYGPGSVYYGPSHLNEEMISATAISVKLDSVLYADGLFEGPDTLSFFDRVSGEIDGIRAVEKRVSGQQSKGLDSRRILDGLAEWAGSAPASPTDFPPLGASRARWACFSRAEFVNDILRVRRKGDNAAIGAALEFAGPFKVHRAGVSEGE